MVLIAFLRSLRKRMKLCVSGIRSEADQETLAFTPALLRQQQTPPNPLGHSLLWSTLAFLVCLVFWSLLGRLDIVAVAEGKLVPQSYVKIVQPAESGIIKEILVSEGEQVRAGQVLMRMDALVTAADARSLQAEYARKLLTQRRIDAELSGDHFKAGEDAPPLLAKEIEAQYHANRAALEAALAEEQACLAKARQDLLAAEQMLTKLAETLPHYIEQEKAYSRLASSNSVAPLTASEKKRERIEVEQDLKSQEHVVKSARAGVLQSEKTLAQIESDYRRNLHVERNELAADLEKLFEEIAKITYREKLLDLRAPQAGIVKDLATHTAGTVVQPGTVLLTMVPNEDLLRAEIWVTNEDIGFVRPGQPVKLKIVSFPFQKYGMVAGNVEYVSVDATDPAGINVDHPDYGAGMARRFLYKALVRLDATSLKMDGRCFPLTAGMQTNAEILLGTRTVAEYLLSPLQKAWHEAARER